MESAAFIGEVIYDGGGNYLVLFKNKEIMKAVTTRFSKKVIENIGTLRVLSTFIEDVDPQCYHTNDKCHPGDSERLYAQHRIDENEFLAPDLYGTLPIVQNDYQTFQPLTKITSTDPDSINTKVTTEQKAKYDAYYKEAKLYPDMIGEKVLDDIVKETRGDSSLLAVIYIDGNGIGAKVETCLQNKTSYDDCVNALRSLSSNIQKICISDRMSDLPELHRVVVSAGDEITIICKATDAYEMAKTYLKNLPEEEGFSSCGGITIFHSHAPFADAYRIAEECCETGKKFMKENGLSKGCFLDFEYCQGAVGSDLDSIREANVDTENSRPWRVERTGNSGTVSVLDRDGNDVSEVRGALAKLGRSNVKGLAVPADLGESELKMEIRRIIAHMSSSSKKSLNGKNDEEKVKFFVERRKLIKDLVRMYDVKFGEEVKA